MFFSAQVMPGLKWRKRHVGNEVKDEISQAGFELTTVNLKLNILQQPKPLSL